MNNPIEYSIEPKSKFSLGFKELMQYRELLYFFTWRDVKVKYKQAALGIVWALIQPLAMVIIFTFVFSKALNVDTSGVPYPLFALSGLIIWTIFSNGLSNSANSMVSNANIIKKIYFPRLVIPISAIITVLIDFLIMFIFYIGVLIYYREHVNVMNMVWAVPLSLLLIIITTFGLGTMIASLNVKYRDFQYVIPFLIQFLMFANPILYNTKSIQSPFVEKIMQFNPIATAININRATFDNFTVSPFSIVASFAVSLLILFIGIYTFRKTENYFADLA